MDFLLRGGGALQRSSIVENVPCCHSEQLVVAAVSVFQWQDGKVSSARC